MAKEIATFLQKQIYLYTIGIAFLVNRTARFLPSFDGWQFLSLLVTFCAINYITIFFVRKMKWMRLSYAIFSLFYIWLVLFWGEMLKVFFDKTFFVLQFRFLLFLLLGLLLIFFVIKKRLNLEWQLINKMINVFIIAFIFISISSGIVDYVWYRNHLHVYENKSLPAINNLGNKDIVWILLDEHASPSFLRNDLHTHEFLADSLSRKGFYVFDSLPSTMDATIYSINAIFNLDDKAIPESHMSLFDFLKESKWIYQLKKLGYKIDNLDFFDIGDEPKSDSLNIFYNTYYEQIFDATTFQDIFVKFNPVQAHINANCRIYNDHILQKFKKDINTREAQPKFTWVHLLMPHYPFLKNENGLDNPPEIVNSVNLPNDIVNQYYVGYLKYCDNVALAMLETIPNWRDKIVIISGDHGFRNSLADNDPRRYATFAAIYSSKMDSVEMQQIKYLQQIPLKIH
ncbi:hypothetical protein ACFOW1_08025 [Parasediminibacterium paludis]|uniref:Sulfatase N-terminal domain-containing protein n=1 Tax=Parasediminibacterium paludis TaxID=908966 RepID=A0ABV8PUL6_9BACT